MDGVEDKGDSIGGDDAELIALISIGFGIFFF